MLFTTIFTLCSMLGAAAAGCNADNCLRAIRASAFPTRSGTADCSSYFSVTVTPAIATVSPTSIPAYASACSGSARYSSACSCIGVSHVTTSVAACTPSAGVTINGGGATYTQYYVGTGFTENTANPGNDYPPKPPLTTTFPGTQYDCETVASSCASFALSQPGGYYSFDLHFLVTENEWECVAYWDPNADPSYFNVANSDVAEGYGYYIF